jgi:hypothetical protein
MSGKLSQDIAVLDGDIFAFHRQHTALLETTQQTADGFYGQAK